MAFASDDVVWHSWKLSAEEHVPPLPHTNWVIGAYVTAGGRIHLYNFHDRLQENAIYFDTDSIIFIQLSGEPCSVATRDKLGDMQSELKPSEFINEFASCGPKYVYRVITNECEETLCIISCIILNHHPSKLVNF